MLGFSYPAGRAIEEEARRAPQKTDGVPPFPIARLPGSSLDFSFSGLKTAVKYFIAGKGPAWVSENRPLVCKVFQEAVVNSLVNNCAAAAEATGIKRVALVGGVACNTRLREALRQRLGDTVCFPPPALCADNGAMIACAGYKRYSLGISRPPHMDPNGTI